MMVLADFDKRRKFASADICGPFASLGERTAGRKMGDIRRQARDLVQSGAFFMGGIRNTAKQTFGIRVRRRREQLPGWSLLENFTGVHNNDLLGHSGYHS